MSIATMKRLNLIALNYDKKSIMLALKKLGAVQLSLDNQFEDNSPDISEIESKLNDVNFGLSLIKKYDQQKKPMLPTWLDTTADEILNYAENEELFEDIIKNAKYLDNQIFSNITQKTRLEARANTLMPYLSFDASLVELDNHKCVYMLLGSIPNSASEQISEIFKKYQDDIYYESNSDTKDITVYFIIAYKKACPDLKSELKTAGFSSFLYEDIYGTPKELKDSINKDIQQTQNKIEELTEAVSAIVQHKELFEGMYDYYTNILENEKALRSLLSTNTAFSLSGYIIDGEQKRIEDTIGKITKTYAIEFADLEKDEDFPIALSNNKIIKPYEAISDMYSQPDPHGMDAAGVVAPFYFIFFGMMMSDAGYGLLLAIVSILIAKKTRWSGMAKKVLGVTFMGGISTVIWGLLYGGVFGISIPPLWFNPLDEPLTTLVVCLGIGIVHLVTGLCVGAYMLIKRGLIWDAIFDKFTWVMILIGVPLLLLGGILSTIGMILFAAGAIIILLFAGRKRPGILKKLMGGFSSLYGISGYLSDVLSYARLFGMGLATGVIGSVFNNLAGMLISTGSETTSFFGYIMIGLGYVFAALIFMVGHAFNFGINALGSYVHSCRLMYIEYYSKFYEDGGKPFAPFKMKSKKRNVVAAK